MSAGIYDWASNKRMMTFDHWVTALRLACLQRRKSARRIGANGCSSWHTPNVPNGGRVNPLGTSPTGMTPDGKKRQVGLENQAVQIWPTPKASAGGSEQGKQSPTGFNLKTAVMIWPTPRANPNSDRQTKPTPSQIKGEHGLNLAMVAVQSSWPTPRTCAGKRSSGSNRAELVNSWAMPTTRDWKDGTATSDVETNCLLGRQAPRSMNDGNKCPLTLNPLFVEWLMGWPINWTIASTGCGCAATALFRWRRLMRSELSRLLRASKSDQLDLFA
jgi:hypothetical protein